MIEIPTWLEILPKKAKINSKDFALALGISVQILDNRISRGTYNTPKPDGKVSRPDKKDGRRNALNYWKAVTVRNHIRNLNRLELEKSK